LASVGSSAETLCPISSGRFFPIHREVKEKDMTTMFDGIKRFAQEEDGAAGIEYALLLAFVALCMVAAGPTVKSSVTTIWTDIKNALSAA